MPVNLKTARVLLFVITGLGFFIIGSSIVSGLAGPLLLLAFLSYGGQAVLALVLGLLLARRGMWLAYVIWVYCALALAWGALSLLSGEWGSVWLLAVFGMLLFFTTRPDSRSYLRGEALPY